MPARKDMICGLIINFRNGNRSVVVVGTAEEKAKYGLTVERAIEDIFATAKPNSSSIAMKVYILKGEEPEVFAALGAMYKEDLVKSVEFLTKTQE